MPINWVHVKPLVSNTELVTGKSEAPLRVSEFSYQQEETDTPPRLTANETWSHHPEMRRKSSSFIFQTFTFGFHVSVSGVFSETHANHDLHG